MKKNLTYILLFLFVTLIAVDSYSAVSVTTKLSDQICTIRKLFCWGGFAAIGTFVVFTIGAMIVAQKINWSYIVIMLIAFFVMVNANVVAGMIVKGNPNCACFL